MKRWLMAATAFGMVVSGAAFAQERGPGGPGGPDPRGPRPEMSQAGRDAFGDARIAALHAGLKLTPDQEKLWPPVEDAIRATVRERGEAHAAREARRTAMRDAREAGTPPDLPGQLRFTADRQAASVDVLRKLADATTPLYAALDDGQKRRAAVLGRGLVRGEGRRGDEHPHGGPGPRR